MKVYLIWWGYGEEAILCSIMKELDHAISYVEHWNKIYPKGEMHWFQEETVCLTKLY